MKTLKVKSMEGAVTGVYYGDLSSNTLIKNTDSLLMMVMKVSEYRGYFLPGL